MPEPTPEPEERDASPERRREEEAMRAPEHDDPDAARDRAGLPEQAVHERPEPPGTPLPEEPDTGRPSPADERS